MLNFAKRRRVATDTPHVMPQIELRAACQAYDGGAITALDNVDLQIKAGECIAIVGASGSGKSSLVNLLCGIDRPTGGTVLWEGAPVHTPRAWAKLRQSAIGIVFQDFNLLPTLTAGENVEIALFGHGLSASSRRDRAVAALEQVGLGFRLRHPVTKLSGGERQRVAIARSIVNQPILLLADEPTGNLDSTNATRVANLLFNLREASGMTLVLVTHDKMLAARCQRQVLIKDGKVFKNKASISAESPSAVRSKT